MTANNSVTVAKIWRCVTRWLIVTGPLPGGRKRAGDLRDIAGRDDATLISELQQMFPAADNAPPI